MSLVFRDLGDVKPPSPTRFWELSIVLASDLTSSPSPFLPKWYRRLMMVYQDEPIVTDSKARWNRACLPKELFEFSNVLRDRGVRVQYQGNDETNAIFGRQKKKGLLKSALVITAKKTIVMKDKYLLISVTMFSVRFNIHHPFLSHQPFPTLFIHKYSLQLRCWSTSFLCPRCRLLSSFLSS